MTTRSPVLAAGEAQVTLYLDTETERAMKMAATAAGLSLSRWVAGLSLVNWFDG